MILPIYIYGQPVLRKVCPDMPLDYAGFENLIGDLFETMYNAEGVGLAGPQIGLEYRIFVMDLSPLADDDPSFKGYKKVFINAHILDRSGEEKTTEEGCLSFPGIQENVIRKDRIQIQYLDEKLQAHDEIYEGYIARVIQHEYDHIDGIMFIDHISGIRKQLLKSKLNNLINGSVKCSYKIKPIEKK